MKKSSVLFAVLAGFCFAGGGAPGQVMEDAPPLVTPAPAASAPAEKPAVTVETIVFIRHGEKPAGDQGQLTFQGLNRALALPEVLIKKYGKAQFVFAPCTTSIKRGDGAEYSYVRPLITIEPTAIRLGLPVNARFKFDEINELQKELLSPDYANAVVFVAWEHNKLFELVKNMVTALGGDGAAVPEWSKTDFDSIYVVKIRTEGEKRTVTFRQEEEGLNGMSEKEPGPRGK